MKNLLFISLVLSIFSCNTKKEEVVDFDDLTQGSKKNYDKDSSDRDEKITFYYDSLSDFSKNLIDSLEFDKKGIFKLDTLFFPDRFGAKKAEKWYLKTEKDSLVYFHWEFKDSVKTYNCFYNWLDCFGKNCKSIHVGDLVSFSKRATVFLIRDKDFFYIESNFPIDYEKVIAPFDTKLVKAKWKFIVNQLPRKKAEWITRED
ncbi:MAG: hypothetical protein V4622_02500 [Bacteroidota bacterium]